MDAIERLMQRVRSDDNGCWVWIGPLTRGGYGRATELKEAHRHAYELLVGPVPDGLVLDHLCRNRACANPAHLEPVTRAINSARGEQACKSSCIHGHVFDEANTYYRPAGNNGKRQCRACNREAVRRYQERRTSA